MHAAPHVVIIDENIHWLLQARAFLEKKGYFVIVREEGSVGLRYVAIQKKNVDLVLLDMVTTDMDAVEALHIMKKNDVLKDILVVVQGEGMGEDETEAFVRMGASACIAKPYTQERLVTIIETVLMSAGKSLARTPKKMPMEMI